MRTARFGLWAVGSILVSALASGRAHANGDNRYAFGDWSGAREQLATKGIVFDFAYGSEIAHNLTGGSKKLTRNAGQLQLDAVLDLATLWGWDGAAFHFTMTERDGNNLNTDAHINALMQSQEVYGRAQTWRLTQMWYSQDVFGKAVQLKVGRVAVGEDFSIVECNFMSLTFCGDQSGNLVGNYWYNYPVSQWGALAKVNFGPHFYMKAGAYQINPSYLEARHSLDLDPAGTTGVLTPFEFGWTPTIGDDLPGSYVVGGWHSSAPEADVFSDVIGGNAGESGLPFLERGGARGAYLTLAQQISHGDGSDAQSGLRMLFNATQADRKTTTNDRTITLAGIYRGLEASRPSDELGVAVGTTHVNGRVARYMRGTRVRGDLPGSEYVMEVYYGWQATRWLVVRPDLQWIHHPGGYAERHDANVVGAKSLITF